MWPANFCLPLASDWVCKGKTVTISPPAFISHLAIVALLLLGLLLLSTIQKQISVHVMAAIYMYLKIEINLKLT